MRNSKWVGKIAYAASDLYYDGYKHEGLSLTRHLSSESDVQVCGAIVFLGSVSCALGSRGLRSVCAIT
jgi:hypothetical protein